MDLGKYSVIICRDWSDLLPLNNSLNYSGVPLSGFIVKEQILGIICLILGAGVLTFCARIERKDQKERRDPKNKWSYIDGEKEGEVAKQNIRGIFLTLVGVVMAVFGLVSFMLNINLDK